MVSVHALPVLPCPLRPTVIVFCMTTARTGAGCTQIRFLRSLEIIATALQTMFAAETGNPGIGMALARDKVVNRFAKTTLDKLVPTRSATCAMQIATITAPARRGIAGVALGCPWRLGRNQTSLLQISSYP